MAFIIFYCPLFTFPKNKILESESEESGICRANCNSDIEKNVTFENLQEMFPHIVKDEIMQVLEIADSHEDAVDALMETDNSKTTEKKFGCYFEKCFPQLQIQS